MTKNCNSVVRQLAETDESSKAEKGSGSLQDKLTLFKLSTAAMMKSADEFLLQATTTDRRWSRALQHEHSLRLELQESMEALAKQMHGMEREARGMFNGSQAPSPVTHPKNEGSQVKGEGWEEEEEEEEKFFDAQEISQEQWERAWKEETEVFVPGHKRNVSTASVNEAQTLLSMPEAEHLPVCSERTMSVSWLVRLRLPPLTPPPPQLPGGPVPSFFEAMKPTIQVRRKSILPKPSHKLNLWTIMKNCIGRDLSKIPMPVRLGCPLIWQSLLADP